MRGAELWPTNGKSRVLTSRLLQFERAGGQADRQRALTKTPIRNPIEKQHSQTV